MNCPQKRCEPSCAFCLDANEPFLAAPLIFLFSYNARTGYQRSAKRECRQGLRIVRYHFFEKAGKRLSCGPAIFAKKLQKSRETYNFTAFYGGPNRDRTDDLTDANRTLSQLSYRPILPLFAGFYNKKLIFKFSDFRRIQRKTSPKSWTETRRSMCDHRDANRTLSQLSYKPGYEVVEP